MKSLISLCFTLLLVFAVTTLSPAEPGSGWDPTDKNQVFLTLQSRIMAIDHAGNNLVVAERKVELFNERESGRELRTMLRNSHGAAIEWKSLNRGDLVFIRGFEQSGAPVVAREIYLLPAGSKATVLPFQNSVPDWNWTPMDKKK